MIAFTLDVASMTKSKYINHKKKEMLATVRKRGDERREEVECYQHIWQQLWPRETDASVILVCLNYMTGQIIFNLLLICTLALLAQIFKSLHKSIHIFGLQLRIPKT